jgi:hypothetical protein
MADRKPEEEAVEGTEVKPDVTRTNPGAPTSVEHTQPEKHFESGGQRTDQKQALQENVKGGAGQAQRHPEQPAGLHSTGSFTGAPDEPEDPSR